MRNLLLITFFLGITVITNAQTPVFSWAKQVGGTSYESPTSMVIDAAGNIYTIGRFNGTTDFDPGIGVTNLTTFGLDDIFVTKFDASGALVWAKQFGGTDYEYGLSIAVDGSGNVYTTGYFQGVTDFDPGAGIAILTPNGGTVSFGYTDGFISKLDASGNFVWVKQIGGTVVGVDKGNGIAVDANGNVFTTGTFSGTVDFDSGAGTSNLTSAGNTDIFILKLDVSGNFVWAKRMGSFNIDDCVAISIDSKGNIYTTGEYGGTVDFDPNAGVSNLTSLASLDIFVSKLDASGNYVWAKSIGGPYGSQFASAMAVDATGNVFTTGSFIATTSFPFTAGTTTLTSVNAVIKNSYVSKIDASGNFVWTKGYAAEGVSSVAVDAIGSTYITGFFSGKVDFDPNAGISNLTSLYSGTREIYILKLDGTGNYGWATQLGGGSGDDNYGTCIALNSTGGIFTAGRFWGTVDFDQGAGTTSLKAVGSWDMFIHKMSGAAVTSVNEMSKPDDFFAVFPNPSNGDFTIQLKANSDIRICNALGKSVFAEKMLVGNQHLNLQNEPNGIYFVKAMSDYNQQTFKLIKE